MKEMRYLICEYVYDPHDDLCWRPLDPQPCCKNCNHYNDEKGRCTNDFMIVDENFYCKDYIDKEVSLNDVGSVLSYRER